MAAFAKAPYWYISPPENQDFLFFISASTGPDKGSAYRISKRNLVIQSSTYIGKFFSRKKLKVINKAYDKDIGTGIYTCFLLARYPRSDIYEKEYLEVYDRKEVEKFFRKTMAKAKKLASQNRISDAIVTLSRAKADKRLPAVKKDEIANFVKQLVTKIEIKPLEYSRLANTSTGLQGQIGVIVNAVAEEARPIEGINVKFSFKKNSGYIEKKMVMTNKKGLAATKVLRFNRPGKAVIAAEIYNEAIPEYSLVQPAFFELDVKGRRVEIAKMSYSLRRGIDGRQDLLLLEDNQPAALFSFKYSLSPEKFSIEMEILPTQNALGLHVDKQVNVIGVELKKASGVLTVEVPKIKEGKFLTRSVGPFDVIFVPTGISRQHVSLPIKGEIDTIRTMIVNLAVFYH